RRPERLHVPPLVLRDSRASLARASLGDARRPSGRSMSETTLGEVVTPWHTHPSANGRASGMELDRIWANLRERWKLFALVAVVTMAVAAALLLSLTSAEERTFRSQVVVSGRIIQNEQYYIDTQETANEIAARAADQL